MTLARKLTCLAGVIVIAGLCLLLFSPHRGNRLDVRRTSAPPTASSEPLHRARATSASPSAAGDGHDDGAPPPVEEPREAWPLRVRVNVPGAEVTLEFQRVGGAPHPSPVSKRTDATGFAGFDLPLPSDQIGRIRALARAPGYAPGRATLTAGEAEITLAPGVRVSGRVVSTVGGPLEGAVVSVDARRTSTGAEGRFELFVDAPGAIPVRVAHSAHVDLELVVEAPVADLLVHLDPGLVVAGSARFPDLRPLPGATVRADDGRVRTTTGPDGRFRLQGLRPGRVAVECEFVDRSCETEAGDMDVEFVVNVHVVGLRVVDSAGARLRDPSLTYRVKSPSGEEFGGGSLDVESMELIALEAGAALVVSAGARDRADAVAEVVAGGAPRLHEVTLVLAPVPEPGTLELRARDDSGAIPRAVYVSLENAAGSSPDGWHRREVVLDEHGRARVGAVPSGTYRVLVTAHPRPLSPSGYGLASESSTTVVAGGATRLDVSIPLGGRLRVSVRNARGELVAAKRLDLLDAARVRVPVPFLRVKPTGGWTTALDEPAAALLAAPVPPGLYRAVHSRDGVELASREVTIPRNETLDVELRVP